MTHLVIVESNTPDRVSQDRANGYLPTAEAYGVALQEIDPTLTFAPVAPYAGEDMVLDGVDGVVFTGSGVIWNTSDTRAKPLQDAMETVFAAGLPTYGSCNGLQLAATILGGEVGESPNGYEATLARDIRMTEAGRTHAMFAGRSDGFAVPCGHRDEVTRLPDGAVLLAGNAHSPVQAFAIETGGVDFWGSQYHPEERISGVARYHMRGDSPDMELVNRLLIAETDEDAAAALGTSTAEMGPKIRMIELRNWLAHVARSRSLRVF
jgi:GMP synthase (glutamine-hydrolysing)